MYNSILYYYSVVGMYASIRLYIKRTYKSYHISAVHIQATIALAHYIRTPYTYTFCIPNIHNKRIIHTQLRLLNIAHILHIHTLHISYTPI